MYVDDNLGFFKKIFKGIKKVATAPIKITAKAFGAGKKPPSTAVIRRPPEYGPPVPQAPPGIIPAPNINPAFLPPPFGYFASHAFRTPPFAPIGPAIPQVVSRPARPPIVTPQSTLPVVTPVAKPSPAVPAITRPVDVKPVINVSAPTTRDLKGGLPDWVIPAGIGGLALVLLISTQNKR